MSEHDPTNREYINIPPLDRFNENMLEVNNYFQLYVDFIKYLTAEFNIPEITSDGRAHTVEQMLMGPELQEYLPTPELFDENPERAIEKMRLMLLRVGYPLAESFTERDDQFTDWVIRTVKAAIGNESSRHDVRGCLGVSPGNTGHSPFQCGTGDECPVLYARYLLLKDSLFLNVSSLEYEPEWRDAKMRRNIAKLDAAHALGMTDDTYDDLLRSNYLEACRGLGAMRKNTE